MKPFPSMAALALGGLFLAGCNPGSDQADPVTEQDQPAAPAAQGDMPPPPPSDTGLPGTDETMAPPPDAVPGTATSPDAMEPTESDEQPPPPDR